MSKREIRRLNDALRILARLPLPIRSAICRKLVTLLIENPDWLARQMELSADHPERYAKAHYIYSVVYELTMESVQFTCKRESTAMPKLGRIKKQEEIE